jgi:hypothetical protein
MKDDLLETVRKIHDLLELLAEDKIAQRDAQQRAKLRSIVGTGKLKQAAVMLMDGTRTQKDIVASSTISKGNASELVSQLAASELLVGDRKHPKLVISLPSNFFETDI